MAAAGNTFAGDSPKGPPNLKEAEAQGLQRVNIEELKKFIPGVIINKGKKGVEHTLTYKADGSVDRTGFNDLKGDWHFDEKKNAYCTGFYKKKGYQENCFAVFRAADGTNFFDYDIDDTFYAHVWHPRE
jgi:hypothetical protein